MGRREVVVVVVVVGEGGKVLLGDSRVFNRCRWREVNDGCCMGVHKRDDEKAHIHGAGIRQSAGWLGVRVEDWAACVC